MNNRFTSSNHKLSFAISKGKIYNSRNIVFGLLAFSLLVIFLSSCGNEPKRGKPISEATASFVMHEAIKTGVDFSNNIKENSRIHPFVWNFIYQGAGVAIGDINNDGLPDIYFGGNMVSDKLYLNKGNFEFEDISESSGIVDRLWTTGVNFVDINADGYLDIYVCKNFFLLQENVRENKLFINNKNNTFTESAAKYGLNDPGYSIQSYFFDAENDGDLDMYLVNQPMDLHASFLSVPETLAKLPYSDKLYINENGKFKDILKSTIHNVREFGLSACISDFDNNGFSDIYVCNDYNKGDHLLMNQGNLKFKNELKSRLNHTSFYSMGSDAADINNDGALDFMSLDMAFASHYKSKTNMESMRPDLFWKLVEEGNHYQYAVNNLQLNNGEGSFSEIAHISGVSNTDWSWAPLFMDFDNDGYKDLLISNGFVRDMRNNDFMSYLKKDLKSEVTAENLQMVLSKLPSNPVSNYAFKNQGELKFDDVSHKVGFDLSGFSTGMAMGDLDGDGDLDLVLNNSNAVASIYENKVGSSNNYIAIRLKGKQKNPFGIGVKASIYYDGQIQSSEMQTAKGYMSGSEAMIHFGLGQSDKIDSLVICWDHKSQTVIKNPELNEIHLIDYLGKKKVARHFPIFDGNTGGELVQYEHEENEFNDYKNQVLLPHKLSQNGPFLDVADVNKDGLEDICIGGAAGQAAELFLQNESGSFEPKNVSAFVSDKEYEDLGLTFLDHDRDGDLDIYISSGGGQFRNGDKKNSDRIYENDGKGNFSKASISNALPKVDGQKVLAVDIDNDDDLDLFIGGRMNAGTYPKAADSYLLINDNGNYSIDGSYSKALKDLGLVTDAIATDLNGDGNKDLIVVGEWMQITSLINEGKSFAKKALPLNGTQSTGWWWTITHADFDGDGDEDFLVGNLGRNNKFKASNKKPFQVFSGDFDDNGDFDVVLAKSNGNDIVPVRGRECSSEEMPFILDKFKDFDAFASATLFDIIPEEKLKQSTHAQIKNFSSVYLENKGNNLSFESRDLPVQCQLGPIKDFVIYDWNKDGHQDFIYAGNHYPVEVETVRYDANRGGVCLGDGKGNFTYLPNALELNCDIRDLEIIKSNGNNVLLATCNNAGLISIDLP